MCHAYSFGGSQSDPDSRKRTGTVGNGYKIQILQFYSALFQSKSDLRHQPFGMCYPDIEVTDERNGIFFINSNTARSGCCAKRQNIQSLPHLLFNQSTGFLKKY